ncbi:hypothetical protein BFN03_03105 [Rhodococcus sp. WMMA185]|uniref:AMIN-like domain-containing (lipo)protein n=1 Tax=Rhodococcus sp. WMMA185 TaxID=679318 RepID=UPI000878BC5B|nr:hypothetical protein [Rhodococcus sp. WMMA185]AOW92024.1 hypothetical protein BFN03_03105 [Rhodococcus sp. WMMA185]
MSNHRIVPLSVFAACTLALSLTACSESNSASSIAASSPVAMPSGSATEPDTEIPVDASAKSSPASDSARLTVTDMRVGKHEGYDRVVYELGGMGTPGWRVEYVDTAISNGSGDEITLPGNGILQVLIDGSAYPFDSGVEGYSGPDPLPGVPGGSVTEVRGALVFEGVTQSFIGVTESDRPFSVSALSMPPRVVVDIAN